MDEIDAIEASYEDAHALAALKIQQRARGIRDRRGYIYNLYIIYMHVYIIIYTIYMQVYIICMYVCMYVCMHIHIGTYYM